MKKTIDNEQEFSPYSLGKLIDWKQLGIERVIVVETTGTPYSLGKLIDWKHKL